MWNHNARVAIENEKDAIKSNGLIKMKNLAIINSDFIQLQTLEYETSKSESSRVLVRYMDVVTAIIDASKQDSSLAVLNFASNSRPGGHYIDGAVAQEEALCRASSLYSCLKKHESQYKQNSNNNGMYTHWAIYTPDVPFFRDARNNVLKQAIPISVISSPAPNRRFTRVRDEEVDDIFRTRINGVLKLAREKNHSTIVLGAWGCGAFGNDPKVVAQLFKACLEEYPVKNVIFAINDEYCKNVFSSAFL
jgi:uncharacterized protein (TIGR02452 family)